MGMLALLGCRKQDIRSGLGQLSRACGKWKLGTLTLLLNNVKCCIRRVAVLSWGLVWAFWSNPTAAFLQPEREHLSYGSRLGAGGDSECWQGAWVGNHLGITMEFDRFAPV